MRIIPKKTKVTMEFFKGVDLLDVCVGMVGAVIAVALFISNIPGRMWLLMIVVALFVTLIMPIDDDKTYMSIYYGLKHLARTKRYRKRSLPEAEAPNGDTAAPPPRKGKRYKVVQKPKTVSDGNVLDITPFTGIDGSYIEYGGQYYGMVLEVPSVEFRFMTENRQNTLIDRVLGSVMRTVTGEQTAAIIKIDRPIIYDDFIAAEYRKIDDIKESYVNGLLSDEEITGRMEVIYGRIEEIKRINTRDRVYRPFHYLAFFDKSKDILGGQVQNAISQLSSNDMDCKLLDSRELAIFLKYSYTQEFDEREIDHIPPEGYMDWIVPKRIEFGSRTVKYDGLITHTLRIIDYPMLVSNAWGFQLFNDMSTRVVLKMKPVERFKAVRRIDRAIDELRGQENSTGKTSKLIELGNHIDTLSELLSLLQSDNETLFEVNVYITIFDYEQTKMLEQRKHGGKAKETVAATPIKKLMKRQLAEQGFKTTDMFLQQFEAYASGHISARDAFLNKSRGIHSGSIAAAFPFVYTSLCDKNGFAIGENGGVPVFINFFMRDRERVNSNMVIIGKSGSGKSYATKTLLANLAAEDSKIFVLDPENEYQVLAENLHGKIIDVGSATQGRLNPFHVITTASDDEENTDSDDSSVNINTSLNTHLQFLEEFFRQILPGIDSDALEYL
ncbi:MAG: DUF87 domain-containing protein, partial [Angelakisella sp.]